MIGAKEVVSRLEKALSPLDKIAAELARHNDSLDEAKLLAARYLALHCEDRAALMFAAEYRLQAGGDFSNGKEARKAGEQWHALGVEIRQALDPKPKPAPDFGAFMEGGE